MRTHKRFLLLSGVALMVATLFASVNVSAAGAEFPLAAPVMITLGLMLGTLFLVDYINLQNSRPLVFTIPNRELVPEPEDL